MKLEPKNIIVKRNKLSSFVKSLKVGIKNPKNIDYKKELGKRIEEKYL